LNAPRAFTLLEMMIVMLIVAALAAGLAMPLAAQVQLRRLEEARRLLEVSREALLGFAATHGRLPCPASEASRGEESFAPGGDGANGLCERFHEGYLPAAALGLAPLDDAGLLRAAGPLPAHRMRYAVFGGSVNEVANALTRANGMQAAGLPAIGNAPHLLLVCASGTGTAPSSCGLAANQLTRRAAFVLVAPGPEALGPAAAGSDAERNLDGDLVFVAHEMTPSFDHLVTWAPVNVLASRLLASGRLP
jgi:prepilin-type N-terminal cleavage/methylation domain-containing protein